MDTKRVVLLSALSIMVMLGWLWFTQAYIYKKHPEWNPANKVATVEPTETKAPTTQDAPPLPATMPVEAIAAQPATQPVAPPSPGGEIAAATTQPAPTTTTIRIVPSAEASRTVVLGESEVFPLQLTLNTTEAAIESATLKPFKAQKANGPYQFQTPAMGATPVRSMATIGVTLNGETIDLTGASWALGAVNTTDAGVEATFTLDLARAGEPIAQLRKTYLLRSAESDSEGYEVLVSHHVINRSGVPLTAQIAYNGPLIPPAEAESGAEREIIVGYAADNTIDVTTYYVESFSDDELTRSLLRSEDGEAMAWVGGNSIYFNALARPVPRGTESLVTQDLSEVKAVALNPDAKPVEREVALTLRTSELLIPAGHETSLLTELFLGPRQRELLNQPYYASFPRDYDETLVIARGPCSICTFTWLVNVLVSLLAAFHWVLRDWGLAIIGLVVLVRLLLHPITKRSQVSMMKMAKMGPEIERLRKKYGDNKEELNKAMMEVYKEQGVTPILGCLPMFLQMPIWIALWQALQTTFELRQAPFLYFFGFHFTWIKDLARPDLLIEFGRSIPLFFGWHISGFNLLPVLMGIVMFIQQKMMPKPAAQTPEQAQQQKMMQYMTLLFPLFLYNGPAGLNLYILTSTAWGIIESRIIRRHIKEQEEAEKADRVIVETRATRGSRRKEGKAPEPAPRRGLAGWLADLQERVEEIRKNSEGRKR